MIRTNCYLPAPQLKSLRTLAERTDVSVAELIRRAIEDYLDVREWPGTETQGVPANADDPYDPSSLPKMVDDRTREQLRQDGDDQWPDGTPYVVVDGSDTEPVVLVLTPNSSERVPDPKDVPRG
jgi:hypothetical protein